MTIEVVTVVLALLPVAAATGWWVAKQRYNSPFKQRGSLKREYFQGLNYLVNEQTDQALDVFMRMMELDDDTVETHLALGSLFRRRGEVDRALRIHQNLIARPQLRRPLRQQATLELAKDYAAAGLLDRAENLLAELLTQGAHVDAVLKRLAQIYEQQKDWPQAIAIAHRKASASGESQAELIAQYYCELADAADDADVNHDDRQAKVHWRKALSTDPECVRAGLALAAKALAAHDYRAALRFAQRALQSNIEFTPLALPLLADAYLGLHNPDGLRTELASLSSRYEGVAPVLPLLHFALQAHDMDGVEEILKHFVSGRPDLAGTIHLILELETDQPQYQTLQQALVDGLAGTADFLCKQCGYQSKHQHWNCPGCQSWNRIAPQAHMAAALPQPLQINSGGHSASASRDSSQLH